MPALTESEARTKLCPLVKSKIGSAEPEHHTHCIASDCMAWRWTIRIVAGITVSGTNEYGVHVNENLSQDERGYCGAFGAV